MNNTTTFSWPLYHKAPIIAIIRGMPAEKIYAIAQAYHQAGLSTIEVTMNTEGAAKIISQLRKDFPGLNIGAGTVCTLADLDTAITAGAQFIVTPILDETVIQKAVASDIPIFPGAFTPTEIYKAWSLGATAVKVFPANQLGPSYIKNVLAPLNDIKLVPTGGVSINNIQSFFQAGAFGVGMGSALLNKRLIEIGDYKALADHFADVKGKIEAFVSSQPE